MATTVREGGHDMQPRKTDWTAREEMLRGVTVEHRQPTVEGVSTSLLESGEGPAMILLHGGIECGGVYWAPVISRLAKTHRLIVPDVPGIGESDPLGRLDADSFDRWFGSLLRTIGTRQPMLVAHSLLGSLAARFATQHGELLRGLVVYGGPAIGPYKVPIGLQLAAIRFGVRPTERNAERFDRWALNDLDAFRRRQPEWYGAFSAYCRSRASVPHVKRAMRELLRAGSQQIPDAQLDRISCPMMLVWGRYDRMVSLSLARAASAKHGWPLAVIDEAGHVPHIEQPEAFVRVLAEIEAAAITHPESHVPTNRDLDSAS
jgi:pimeloyl-ACP methyl ester carboxylesterase